MNDKETASKALVQLCSRVAKWREREGGRMSRVPDSLWQEAVVVAGKAGLYTTARAIRFNYARLKKRLENAAANGRKASAAVGDVAVVARRKQTSLAVGGNRKLGVDDGKSGIADVAMGSSSRFIAVQMPAAAPASRTTIELMGRRGDRMRVEVAGDIDVIGLAHVFLGRQA
jgi:hypothetical protein